MRISYRNFGMLALILAAACWAGAPSFAQHQDEASEQSEEGEHHESSHDSEMEASESEHELVSEIFTRDLLIQDFIATGQLTKIHKPAFEAKDLVESLAEMSHSEHESSSSTQLSAASKRIGASAKLLDQYGDAEDAAKTGAAYKTFGAAIQDIRALYPDLTPEHYWTCSMHPDVWTAVSGACAKCGMKLTEKGASHDDEDEESAHSGGHEMEGNH